MNYGWFVCLLLHLTVRKLHVFSQTSNCNMQLSLSMERKSWSVNGFQGVCLHWVSVRAQLVLIRVDLGWCVAWRHKKECKGQKMVQKRFLLFHSRLVSFSATTMMSNTMPTTNPTMLRILAILDASAAAVASPTAFALSAFKHTMGDNQCIIPLSLR